MPIADTSQTAFVILYSFLIWPKSLKKESFPSVLSNHHPDLEVSQMPHRTYPLRLSPSMREQVERVAKKDQISVNHFIALALAEKLSRMEHEAWMEMNVPPHLRHPHTPGTFAA